MGTNINATVTCAPKPYSVSPAQGKIITDYLLKHGATVGHVELGYEDGTPGAEDAVSALSAALNRAGLTTTIGHAVIYSNCERPGSHGFFFDCFRKNDPLTELVANALLAAGVISVPAKTIPIPAWAEKSTDGPVLMFGKL